MRPAAPLPEFARVSRLIFLGRLDDALELLRSLGPHERLGGLVVLGDVIQQELLKLAFRSVHALRQTLFAKDTEEAFDQVNPGGMWGGVMEVDLRMSSQPALGGFVFVNVEVVENDAQLPFWKGADHVIHESQKVHRRAPLFDVCHDFSAGDLQSRQQGLRAVTDVLVGPTPGLLRTQGQQRLGTVQGLDAGLFIYAEYQRVVGRVQVEADDVQQFGLEIGIGTEGEGANPNFEAKLLDIV